MVEFLPAVQEGNERSPRWKYSRQSNGQRGKLVCSDAKFVRARTKWIHLALSSTPLLTVRWLVLRLAVLPHPPLHSWGRPKEPTETWFHPSLMTRPSPPSAEDLSYHRLNCPKSPEFIYLPPHPPLKPPFRFAPCSWIPCWKWPSGVALQIELEFRDEHRDVPQMLLPVWVRP